MKYFTTLFFALLSFICTAQNSATWLSSGNNQVNLCSSTTLEYKFRIADQETGATLNIALPTGYEYGGSFSFTNATATSVDSNDPANPVFTFTADPGEDITLSFSVASTCGAFSSGTQEITATLFESDGTQFTGDPDTGLKLEDVSPEINIISVTDNQSTIAENGTITRTVVIQNGGFGDAYHLFIKDESVEGTFTYSNPTTGTITTTQESGNDIATIYIDRTTTPLEENDQLTVSYDLTLKDCSLPSPYNSDVTANFACASDGDVCNQSPVVVPKSLTRAAFDLPDIDVSLNVPYSDDGCWDNNVKRSMTLTNNGDGDATNLVVAIGPGSYNSLTFVGSSTNTILTNSFTVDGASIMPSKVDTRDVGSSNFNSCWDTPGVTVDRVELEIASLPAGESIVIEWETKPTCPQPDCAGGLFRMDGVAYEYNYSDKCQVSTYGTTGPVLHSSPTEVRIDISPAVEGPLDLNAGQCGTFRYKMSTLGTGLLRNHGDDGLRLFFELEMPEGMTYTSGSALFRDRSLNAFTSIQPAEIEEIPAENKVRFYFENGTGNGMLRNLYSGYYLEYEACANCDGGGGAKNMELSWGVDYSESMLSDCMSFPETYYCTSRAVFLHCPDCDETNYMSTMSLDGERTSTGVADDNNDYKPSGGPALDLSKVNLKAIGNGDYYQYTTDASVTGSLPYGYFEIMFDGESANINKFTFQDGTYIIYDNANMVKSTGSLSAPTRTGSTDVFDIGTNFVDGDQIELTLNYRLLSNESGELPRGATHGDLKNDPITATGNFYGSLTENPTDDAAKLDCDNYSDEVLVVRNFLTTTYVEKEVVGCEQNGSSIIRLYSGYGPGSSSYNGGEFRFEYRDDLVELNDFEMTIPSGLEAYDFRLEASSASTSAFAITPDGSTENGDGSTTYNVDMSQYMAKNGGSIYIDGGQLVNVYYKVRPKCGITETITGDIDYTSSWTFPNTGDDVFQNNTKSVTVIPSEADLALTSPQTYNSADGSGVWDGTVANLSTQGDVKNVFLYPNIAGTDLTITKFQINGSDVSPDANGFYQLGDLAKVGSAGNQVTYHIEAEGVDCDPDDLPLIMGYACEGYPTSLEDACIKETILLDIAPLPSAIQSNVVATVPSGGAEMCEPFDVAFTIKSTKTIGVEDVNFILSLPGKGGVQGYDYVANSATYTYTAPDGTSITMKALGADAENKLTTGGTSIPLTLNEIDPTQFPVGGEALSGSTENGNEITINLQVQPNCDATNGGRISLQTFANRPCGDPATGNGVKVFTDAINLAGVTVPYEASVSFTPGTTASCSSNEIEILGEFQITGSNPAGTADKVYLEIPADQNYVANSFTSTSASVFTVISETAGTNGETIIELQIPDGYFTSSDGAITFSYDVEPDLNDLSCGANAGALSGRLYNNIAGLMCGDDACSSLENTIGSFEESVTVEKPALTLELSNYDFNETTDINEFDLRIVNNGDSDSESGLIVEFYCAAGGDLTNLTYISGEDEVISSAIAKDGGEIVLTDVQVKTPTCSVDGDDRLVAKVKEVTESSTEQCVCAEASVSQAPDNILPITLGQLSGEVKDCQVHLTWNTYSEINGIGFEIQKSADGSKYKNIGFVAAQNQAYGASYSFIDENYSEESYYRIKVMTSDAQPYLSGIIRFSGTSCDLKRLVVFPNPVNDVLYVSAHVGNKMQYKIFDTKGQVMKQGENVKSIRTSDLSKGMYMIQINENGKYRRARFVKN